MKPNLAVIIATKNRASAIKDYALNSLLTSSYKNFVCVIWDASDNSQTEKIILNGEWTFEHRYFKAFVAGSASQRNEAVEYLIKAYPSVCYFLFIDDDCVLSEDALEGILETFEKHAPSIVNLPMKSHEVPLFFGRVKKKIKALFGVSKHASTSFLYNYGSDDEPRGVSVEWASGGGMAVDVSLFKDLKLRFPEAFQHFGGYALGEDFAFSYFVFKKLKKKIVNSLQGHFLHYHDGSARLDLRRMAASKWYNFHLLFDALYDDIKGLKFKWLRFQFKAFMWAAALKLLIRARSVDVPSVLRGVDDARLALAEYYKTNDGKLLMCKDNSVEDAES